MSSETRVIKFYSVNADYGAFSNFSAHPFSLAGKQWPTVEHYFQAKKFEGTEHEHEVRRAKSPMIAARLGRSRKRPLRKDWEAVKEDVMYKALIAKFGKHDDICELLLSTGDAKLIEDSPGDYYWGCGGEGTGRNRLGALLMLVRDAFVKEKAELATD